MISPIRNSQFAIRNCSQGFTLVELLVVIGIIGILAGVLLASFGGSTESARAAQCLSNMRNLATAANTMAVETRNQRDAHYPLATTRISMDIKTSKRTGAKKVYIKHRGWIDMYPGESGWNDSMASAGRAVTAYETDFAATSYVLTNGAVWAAIGRKEGYVCPSHKIGSTDRAPVWSYVMNNYFNNWISYGSLKGSERMLLFAELPFGSENGSSVLDCGSTVAGSKGDGVVPCDVIGFNHMAAGKRCAHVAFADGHVEKLRSDIKFRKGEQDSGQSEFRELTKWLCTGVDFTFNGTKYQKLDK